MSEETGQTVEESKSKEAAQEASALDKLTDRVEERELDASTTQKAISGIVSSNASQGQDQRIKGLSSVKIKSADVEFIMHELEISKKTADQRLREHEGNLAAAIESFL